MSTNKGHTMRETTGRAVPHRSHTVADAHAARGGDALVSQLTAAHGKVREAFITLADLKTLTDYTRAHLPRSRAGAERYMHSLAELATERPELAAAAHLATGIEADLAIAGEAQKLIVEIDRVRQLVADVALEHASHAWTAGLDVYAIANAAARVSPDLATVLAPVTSFLERASSTAAPAAAEPASK